MKNFKKSLSLAIVILMTTSTIVMAETTFTPLNFDSDTSSISAKSTTASSVAEPKGTDLLDPSQVTGGTKMQNAILQIDNAQVDLRTKLLQYKNTYAEVDSRYTATKAERKAAKKQVKLAEKKIKNLDKTKKEIQKNFQRKNNVL